MKSEDTRFFTIKDMYGQNTNIPDRIKAESERSLKINDEIRHVKDLYKLENKRIPTTLWFQIERKLDAILFDRW